MRKWLPVLLAFGAMTGCESKTKFAPKEFSDEEKRKIATEDKTVEDEESQGKATKKAGKKS
jgi:hypothetical protein